MNQNEAIIRALMDLGGEGTIQDIHGWLDEKHPNTWKDVGTALEIHINLLAKWGWVEKCTRHC